ncbi:MAG TPA: HlyD family secretion protein [Syntrophorhabdales bacterium]|nr:HlyD family secretion protein [Syntrophorhabdales bacterium]
MMEKVENFRNHRKKLFIVVGLIIVGGIVSVLLYWNYKATHISTDDAFVEGRIHSIASKVAGTVKKVNVQDNQYIKAGETLLELDSIDFDVRVNEASTSLDAERLKLNEQESKAVKAQKQMVEMEAQLKATKADLAAEEANLQQAKMDLSRYEGLYKQDAVSKERYERVTTGFKVNEAQLEAARARVKRAEAAMATQAALVKQTESAVSTQKAKIKNKEAMLAQADLNRTYTKINAPADGYVTKKSVEVGNQVSIGMPLLAVVPLDDIWIVANYKETQLKKVKRGQKVLIEADMYGGRRFKGIVDSIMAGTGTIFSLFPPENATGNYVKVVQRIPVKITLDKESNRDHVLRVGMSVVPTIIVE